MADAALIFFCNNDAICDIIHVMQIRLENNAKPQTCNQKGTIHSFRPTRPFPFLANFAVRCPSSLESNLNVVLSGSY